MLDPKAVDLRSLCEALEDHSDYTEWWFDPATGTVEPWSSDWSSIDDVEEEHTKVKSKDEAAIKNLALGCFISRTRSASRCAGACLEDFVMGDFRSME